ncbi:MAG: hypothetical protein AB4911_15130 [Oscillochloridaceae bacterium umkhey_bin13]
MDATTNPVVRFNGAAPEDAHLRFAGIGGRIEVSFDQGQTWQRAQQQAQERNDFGHFRSYWTPVPAGTTQVHFRGEGKQDWYTGPWMARDIAVWQAVALPITAPTAVQPRLFVPLLRR